MNLIELRTFLTIIETGSLVRASEQLNVTQSTVTARLKSLEDELGQSLINRQKSGATLTASGVRLQRYASTISDLWKQAYQATALPEQLNTVVNIGGHPDLWVGLGEPLFNYIKQSQPQAALSYWEGSETDLTTWLNAGLIDLALGFKSNTTQNQNVLALYHDELILVSTTPKSPIKFDPYYVFVEAGDEFGNEHAAAYADADTARISFGNAKLGLEYVLNHGGTCYLPRRVAEPKIKSRELFELSKAPIFKRDSFLLYNRVAIEQWEWFDDCLKTIKVKL